MRRLGLGVAVFALACGPAIELVDDATSEGSSGGDDDAPAATSGPSPMPGTTTASPPPPATSTTATVTTADPTAASVDTGDPTATGIDDDCGCGFLCDPCFDPCTGEPLPDCPWDSECDLFAQDCPEAEKCMPWANDGGVQWNATRCAPIFDTAGPPGAPCQVEGSNVSGIDDCELGSMCWDVDPSTNVGTCAAMCTGSADVPVCPDGHACLVANEGSLPICLPTCDPLAGDCAEAHGCVPNDAGAFVCVPAPSPQIVSAATCAHLGGCEPGSVCVPPDVLSDCREPDGCCTTWCDLQNPACGSGRVCQPFGGAAGQLGVCEG